MCAFFATLKEECGRKLASAGRIEKRTTQAVKNHCLPTLIKKKEPLRYWVP
jgi:hypothetical protein